MKSSGIGLTDIGKQRQRNEDFLLVDDEFGLYIIADGIGGYAAGDVAARLAIETAAQHIYEQRVEIEKIRAGHGDEVALSSMAATAVANASRIVFKTASANPHLMGMGCTLTLLLLGNRAAAMAHVGDSRLYLSRHGRMRQLSTDHNLAAELVELGIIEPAQTAHLRSAHVLTRSIGRREDVIVEELLVDVNVDDQFVLCTDGLSNYLAEPQDLHSLLSAEEFESSARRLVEFANAAGGDDNITAIVVRIDQIDESAVASSANVALADGDTPPIEYSAAV
ncbi:MAG: protein phosphatase 2C domain-containing protein [Proteobacteria bacterium]|nr:protein phosphatase 2C domain-containing protein [Pseudomonadota bacterium]